ncbi:MAG: hypothetical protein RLZZ508_1047 [Actinomycetota bacterium]
MSRSKLAIITIQTAILALISIAFIPNSNAASAPLAKKYLWQVEFNGKAGQAPSSKFFKFNTGGGGWGNSEEQFYVNTRKTSATDGNGKMVFTASKISYDSPSSDKYFPYKYKSARIYTKGKLSFKYGRMEARIKLPAGVGTWPAFWMLGTDISSNTWPDCGEIDIMEAKGSLPNTTFGTIHGPGYFGGGGISGGTTLQTPLTEGYHVYAINWKPNSIEWYIDDQLYHSVTKDQIASEWVFNKRFFLILNLAMGGLFTGEIDPSIEETKMYIDWIRYSKFDGWGQVYYK